MKPINSIDLGKRKFTIKGKELEADLIVNVYDDLFNDNAVRLQVKASFGGFSGFDSLGDCLIPDPNNDESIEAIVAEYGMDQEALVDLVKGTETQIKFLKLNGLVA